MKPTILLIEDNEQNCYELQVLLAGNGYAVVTAADGAEALEKARQNPPDLVITDILMPVMDGFSLCREWMRDERLRDIPLVFYTATYTDEKDRELGLSLGAARFIIKPEEPEDLLRTIQSVIAEQEHGTLAASPMPPQGNAVFLKEYSEALIRKLEDKMRQLEQTNRELERDISERKQSEGKLAALYARHEAFLAAVPDIIVEVDCNKVYTWANQAGLAFFGADVIGKEAAFYFEGNQTTYASVQPLFDGREDVVYVESWQRRRDGVARLLAWSCRVLKDGNGKVTGVLSSGHDITDQRRAEEALKLEQTLFNSLVSTIPDHIYFKDRQSRFIRINKAMAKWFGLRSPDEAVGKTDFDVFSEEHARQAYGDEQRIMSTGDPLIGFVEEETWPDGHVTWVSTTKVPLRDADGNITGLVGVSRNITEQMQAEKRIREQAALLDKANDAIYVRTLDHTITYWNRGAEQLYGWSAVEAVGRKETDLFLPATTGLAEAESALSAQSSWAGEMRHSKKNSGLVTVFCRWSLVRDDEGKPKLVFAIHTDVTEKKQLEARFLRAQRMESIGALASGIAHDLNNVLAPIVMGAQLLQPLVTSERGRHVLATIEASAQRGAGVVKQVLTFARGIEGERVPLQLKHLIKDMVLIASETFPKNIRIEIDIAPDLWSVLGDVTQIHQALMNLCVNARDAMPSGGTLTLCAANVTVDETFKTTGLGSSALITPDPQPGPKVRLSVIDTGTGISPEHLDKVFEPFFTTKGPGKGTGLGLSTVLGIVRSHGGFVRVKTEEDKGTCFELYVPATPKPQIFADQPVDLKLLRGQGQLIMVIDDEAAVREVVSGVLEHFGFKVVTAAEGSEAVGIFVRQHAAIAAVISDMVMPGMDGPALVRILQQIDPGVRIIGMSGFAERIGPGSRSQWNLPLSLTKPFTAERLLLAVHELLQPPAARPAGGADGGTSKPAVSPSS
jgi:PAS domain S-box-containing protein